MGRWTLPGPDWSALGVADDPWEPFAEALRRHLRRPGAVGTMQFTAPRDAAGNADHCTVQIAADASHAWITYRRAGSDLCEELLAQGPPSEPGPLAVTVVATCRERMGVPHPQLLTLRCQGFVGQFASSLGLPRAGAVPLGNDPADPTDEVDTAIEVDGPEDVRDRFAEIIERVTGQEPEVTADGDLVVDHVGRPVHVSFDEDTPTVRIRAWVVRGVRSREATAIEIARRNRDEEWTQWVLVGRHVEQRTILSAGPFVPRTVQFHLERFLYTFADTCDDIARRLG